MTYNDKPKLTGLALYDERMRHARMFREKLQMLVPILGEPVEVGLLHASWGPGALQDTHGGLPPALTGEAQAEPVIVTTPDCAYVRDPHPGPYIFLTTQRYDATKLMFSLFEPYDPNRSPKRYRGDIVTTPEELLHAAQLAKEALARVQEAINA